MKFVLCVALLVFIAAFASAEDLTAHHVESHAIPRAAAGGLETGRLTKEEGPHDRMIAARPRRGWISSAGKGAAIGAAGGLAAHAVG